MCNFTLNKSKQLFTFSFEAYIIMNRGLLLYGTGFEGRDEKEDY